ncbi:PTS fructose transporter subunit IIBC [Thermogemmatispora aurantia]|uniref:PTS fructose transporter subunit IIBC n=1 Tax=Thermogemmatispora aurantia TaxID=2045279 RepID=A0A5J4KG18_9CHLR|nr:fructose-specific PTS transporter subunit EIIC [Thermogemmatispora aurantia]GER85350.1 PTS fructose transporter subunit IIBC [Thermogemmatispora aurantia]
MARIVAITSCPTGIAHTFMAAEGLQRGAEALGHTIKVETQGSVGAQNTLTPEEIAAADVVIIAADTKVDLRRFSAKTVYETSTSAAIKDGQTVIREALARAAATAGQVSASASGAARAESGESSGYLARVQQAKAAQAQARRGPYKHLLTGVSYMIPFVVAGGILIALAFAIAGYRIAFYDTSNLTTLTTGFSANPLQSVGAALFVIGAKAGFLLFVPILSGFIAYSIADRPGIAPGMIGGVLASLTGSGFLGGIIAGFLAGYLVYWMNRSIRLPSNLAGLMPVLILPLFGSLIVGLLMLYVVGTPVALLNQALVNGLKDLQGANAAVLGLIIGLMMAFDMGGPVNKAAYAFSTGLLLDAHNPVYLPMAAAMAAGMTPPLGLALATLLFKNRFTPDEREAGKAAWVLGLSFITEGAIPFAANDPFRVIPSIMVGSAVTGALSAFFGCQLHVPHGGIWVMFLPGVVGNLPQYLLSIVVGTLVTTGMLFVLKRPITVEQERLEAALA